ncbi:Spc97 / Spc98 family [Musa troglodytarum]|uniref:Spc97 / Spc98 family n=1 Tax=Musa troglodytarum TaxID=320322 RepID=A0A9E7L302_9LILI|nr:Spc97 / Spc98 family [Musa troglodytarum]
MEIDPNFSSLLRTLRVDDPWVPPKTWESIPSESGRVRSADSCGESQDPIYESSLISESNLVHLVVNALLGVKSSIMEIDKLAAIFSSSPADRTFHRVPTLWCRSLSTSALGKILKCISHSGLVVCLLQKFVNFYQCANRDVQQSEDKGDGSTSLEDTNFLEDLLGSPPNRKVVNMNEIWMQPPYSLINQAFAVAVKKVLQGYFGALNTMQASVNLRRSAMTFEKSVHIPDGSCGYTKISQSGITLLEVFLHTNELRTQIESLGNICFPRFADLAVSREALIAETNIEFHNFPRGVDLLSYLYLQLRNADPIHHALLKHLFVGSCEPYCGFIKSWIFRASIDDPYREFFVHKSTKSNAASESVDKLFLTEIKEQIGISVPCFLKDVHRPLVRAGLQLQVLVKFLSLFNFDFVGRRANSHCNLANIEEILPCWVGMSTDSAFLSNSLTFCKPRIEALICQRQNMYQMMLKKLQVFFSKSDIRYERMNHMVRVVIPFNNAQSLYSGRSPNIPIILLSGADYVFSATTDEPEATRCTTQNATDASYTSDESSHELDSLHNSENSFYSSEEEIESEGFLTSGNHVMPPEYLLHSDSLPCYTIKIPFPNSNEIGRLCFSQASCYSMPKQHGSAVHHYKNEKTNSSVSFCCGDEKPVMTPVLSEENYNSDNLWPVGLLEAPFYDIINYRGPKQPCLAPQSIQMTDETSGTLENTKSVFDKVIVPFSSKLDTVGRFEFMDARIGPWCHDIFSSWNSNEYYDLSANPILTRFSWFSSMDILKDRSSNKRHRSHFPYFDFSSVVDPCNFSGNVLATPDHGLEVEASRIGNSNLATAGSNGILADSVQHSIKDQPDLRSTCSSNASREAHHTPGHLPSSVCGGAPWVGSLHYSNEIESCAEDKWHDSGAEFEMPPDVVIDKCIVQEILLQYKYVSNFAIKLLEEGFDLHEHLLALRRYHFMELADWADTFIISVCKRKWSVTEPEKKVAEMQGILELSLQRSSCETDQYKERLYVYMNGQNIVPVSNSSAGLNIFDFMLLGYKVDWPIKIIVTPAALNIYAEIFRYLIQVRLATFSLVEVWYYIKMIIYKHFIIAFEIFNPQLTGLSAFRIAWSRFEISQNRLANLDKIKVLNIIFFSLMNVFLQQMNHFLSALQQYLHSQLSNVSWSRFQHSLKHQVKDMLDLESVHMSYLAEALHICFLSEDTKPVAVIIENILQCALDFGLHLTGGHLYAGTNRPEPLNLQSDINLCKVSTIQTIFERNLKDLYLLYLKSPKHVDFSLCRFWDHLNYNEYYSNIFNKDTGYLCL